VRSATSILSDWTEAAHGSEGPYNPYVPTVSSWMHRVRNNHKMRWVNHIHRATISNIGVLHLKNDCWCDHRGGLTSMIFYDHTLIRQNIFVNSL
jgi:hypothetical protein